MDGWVDGPAPSSYLYMYFCFVFPGTNLLSGGVESVLVQWRYNQESERDFLPRLGAAITHITISPDGALFCTSHSDNSKELLPVICFCMTASSGHKWNHS